MKTDRSEPTVKAFGADGTLRRRRFTENEAEELLALKAVLAQRNLKGAIVCIHFYGASSIPLKSRLRSGTRYSHRETITGGRQRWTLKQLPGVKRSALSHCGPLPAYRREYARLQSAPFRAVLDSISR